jgi:hypothetical protein
MIHKVFETQRKAAGGQRVTFEINGETYEAAADAPGGALLTAASMEGASPLHQLEALGQFLDAVLFPESRERFEAALRSPDSSKNVTLEDAANIVTWLIQEVYVGRPTTQSSGLPNAASPDGMNLTPDAPLPDSTPS